MNAHNSSIHLRLLHSPAKLVILPPSHRREIDAYLVAAKVEAKGQVVAVTGASVTKETVQSAWKRSTAFFNDKEDAHLYWLDEGGHIIESNQVGLQPGMWIGSISADPQLMKALLAAPAPFYRKVTVFQHNANCIVIAKSQVSASSFVGANSLMKLPMNFLRSLVAATNFIYASLLSLISSVAASSKSCKKGVGNSWSGCAKNSILIYFFFGFSDFLKIGF